MNEDAMEVENFVVAESDGGRDKAPPSEKPAENLEKADVVAATGDDGTEVGVSIEEGYGEASKLDTSSSDEEVRLRSLAILLLYQHKHIFMIFLIIG